VGFILLFISSGMLVKSSVLKIVTMQFADRNRALHNKITETVLIKAKHDLNRE